MYGRQLGLATARQWCDLVPQGILAEVADE
jgi:hypothetical protein